MKKSQAKPSGTDKNASPQGTSAGTKPTGAVPARPAAHPSKSIGSLLRERRLYHRWTLSDVSRLTGISSSALSKIENDKMSPTYQTIIQLCSGLDIEIGDLFGTGPREQNRHPITARRSVSRAHEGSTISDDNYAYTYLCGDVAHKRIIPMIVEVRANSFEQIGSMWSHVGEEFIYVLDGEVALHTEYYEHLVLRPKDSVYIDSTMLHAFLAVGDTPATILVLCSSATPNLAQTLRDILKERLKSDGVLEFNEVVTAARGGR